MPIKLKAKPVATATTSKTTSDKSKVLSEDNAEEKVDASALGVSGEALLAPDPWCEVGIDASYTKNLGNYQSCRIGVSLKVPCRHDEIDDVFSYGSNWVDAKMKGMMEDLDKGE